MNIIFLNLILIIFPILMYLVFTCYSSLNNKKVARVVFIITIMTSLYLGLEYSLKDINLLIFSNIPLLICYFKKEGLLGICLSIIIIIYSSIIYNINIYIEIIKHLSYFITYIILYKKKEFNYLFLKIISIIQGFFLSFEYFINSSKGIDKIITLMLYIAIIYILTFFSLYLFKIADNITNLYQEINKIKEENKLKNSLFKLTHEIKNPIAVCKGYLDMLNLEDLNKSKRYLSIIKSEIDRSLNVISDFMEYSKIKINKEELDIVMLLDDIYESFNLLIKDKNIKLNYHNEYEEIYLIGDYERLKQVFINVIKNSIESIAIDGIINIEVKLNNQNVIIIIEDNGCGMNKEELSHLKEMFYTTKKNGTGLGVSLSNEIIIAHNGKMNYESNKGTKCTITLPL